MDETSTAQLIKNSVGAGVRWTLVLLAGVLVKKGIISTEDSTVYVEQATPVVVGVVIAAGMLAWSLWQKRHANQKVDLALSLSAGTDRKTLEKKIDQGVQPPPNAGKV